MFQCLFLRLGIDGCTTHSVYHLTTGVCSSGRGFTLSAAIADLGDGPTRIGLSLDGGKINPGNQHTDTLLNRLSLLRRNHPGFLLTVPYLSEGLMAMLSGCG